jgi:sugar/nucleoside kinase (ribokinase family)
LADFDPVVPASLSQPEFVMLGNLSPQVQLTLLERLTNKPKLVVMDTMNFWMDIALEDLKKALKKVDVLTINDEEARQLSGEYSLLKASRVIREMGPQYLIIKKGEHGALLFHGDQVFSAPAMLLEDVFDPTGAGDTFAGGFAGFITQQGNISFETMKTAIIQGSNLASFCVEKFGTERMVELEKEEVQERLKQFRALTLFEIELS